MNCLFCPEQEINVKGAKLGLCDKCETEYDFFPDGKLWCYTFRIIYREHDYFFDFLIEEDGGMRFDLCKEDGKSFITLKYFPDFTPHNALNKLPTLLVFS